MSVAANPARIVGVLILAQMAGGVLVNFVLAAPLFGSPGFLVNAAPHSVQIAVSVLLGLATGALSLAIAITVFPLFRRHALGLALWYVALAGVSLAAMVVEQISVMSMLSLQGLRIVVASARNGAHYLGLIVAGSTIFVLYSALYRFALVPRSLAVFGMTAALLQIVAVAMPLFGYGVIFLLLAPLGVSQLILAVWLIVKGFRDPAQQSLRAPGAAG